MSDTETPATPETSATPVTPALKRKPSREDSHCSVEGCKRPYRAKTYCNVHYAAWRRGEIASHTGRYKICTKEACRKPRAANGSFCVEHAAKEKEVAA